MIKNDIINEVGEAAGVSRQKATQAVETISYGMPTFTLNGHLVAFAAFKKHLSFFPMSSTLISRFPEAKEFATSTGTMQFQPDKPIPPTLIKKMVQDQIEKESYAFFATARVWDDSIIDPRDTRTVLGIALSAVHNDVIEGTEGYGVFRM